MKHFLVPTDFSNLADRAVVFATKLALKLDGEILFLHAYEVPFTGAGAGSMRNLDQLHRKDAQKKLDVFEKKMKEEYPTLKFKTYNDASLPVDSIKSFCEEKAFDLVIMGTAGSSGMVDEFLGSTTSNVIGKINAPLIAIPGTASMEFPKKFLVATDFKSKNYLQELKPIYELAKVLDATIDFVSVRDSKSANESNVEMELKNSLGSFYGNTTIIESEDVELGLTNYVEENQVDLLAVISHNKGFWEKLWHKSMSKSLVKHSSIPVVVLQEV